MANYPKTAWQDVGNRQSSTAHASRTRTRAGITVGEAIADFLEAAENESALDRFGRAFGPASLSELRWCLTGHVNDRLGAMDLGEVRRRDVEALMDDLAAAGLPPRRLRTTAKSLQALYDYARERDLVAHNPAERIALPDGDDAEQPSRGRPESEERGPLRAGADHALIGIDRAIALGLQVITVCFVLLALVLIAESL
jgi:hypothetical protein